VGTWEHGGDGKVKSKVPVYSLYKIALYRWAAIVRGCKAPEVGVAVDGEDVDGGSRVGLGVRQPLAYGGRGSGTEFSARGLGAVPLKTEIFYIEMVIFA